MHTPQWQLEYRAGGQIRLILTGPTGQGGTSVPHAPRLENGQPAARHTQSLASTAVSR